MRVAKLRVYKQAKDKIQDAHCKYVKFVTEHAEGYLDPRFGAIQMAPCSRRASAKRHVQVVGSNDAELVYVRAAHANAAKSQAYRELPVRRLSRSVHVVHLL